MTKSVVEFDDKKIKIIMPDTIINYSCREGRNAIDDHIDDISKELDTITKKNLWTPEEKEARVKENIEMELKKLKIVNEIAKCLQTELVNSVHSIPYKFRVD